MADNSNKKAKLLYLASFFEQKTDEEHPATLQEISDYLAQKGIKAERKTLYDDIAVLRDFGYDIIGMKNKRYGYYLGQRDFEVAELKLLVDAVQSSKFITLRKSKSLIKKLETLTSDYNGAMLERQVFVADRVKNSNESIYYSVDKIHEAINNNKNITFKYFDWTTDNEKKFRHNDKLYCVSPWAMCWNDENYYLIAYEEETEKIKHFRVDKMMYITILSESRRGKKEFESFDLSRYLQRFFGMFDGEYENVTLKCDNDLCGVIIDRFGKSVKMYEKTDKTFKVDVDVAVSSVFFGWVMSMGDKITITSPNTVKNEMIKYINRIRNNYEK